MALTYKDIDDTKLSKGMSQYMEIKRKHMDSILFFRLGDFYEMFFDDAQTASRELELTLTSKDCGDGMRAPMCGVPHHSSDSYVKRLVEKGYSVVICEQMEDPALAKGIVKREVTKIVTPGTVTESSMLDDASNNWLASVYYDGERAAAVCFADVSTGQAHLYSYSGEDIEAFIVSKLSRYSPSEILCHLNAASLPEVADLMTDKLSAYVRKLPDSLFDITLIRKQVYEQFANDAFEKLGLSDEDPEAKASAMLFGFINATQIGFKGRFVSITRHLDDPYMTIGYTARNNLELVKTIRSGTKKGTLMWVLNKTKTSMGQRMLNTYIEQPLLSPTAIMKRQGAVEALLNDNVTLSDLRDELDGVYDLERIMTRVMYRSASPGDLLSLASTAKKLPGIKSLLSGLNSELIGELNANISDLSEIAELIDNAIDPEAPQLMKDSGYIRSGFNKELDRLRTIAENGRQVIEDIAANERELTGIKNLKTGYNRVFGYYIEVTKSFYDKVPSRYIRKQTLANCERFITKELKETENTILGASDRIVALEAELFARVRDYVAQKLTQVQKTSAAVAEVDTLASLAIVALENNYCKPDIAIDGVISIKNGRHPVVEQMLTEGLFVPNDAYLDLTDNRLIILTGPNMSGKSTYMRQIAIITLMAQIGSFVPADYAKISVVDQIFTRVGASDDLTAGQSTFMVEMSEVAEIMKHATKNSLVILDEVGRGTSTFDGISIARSVAEYISNRKKIGCKTLFATHYHELIELEDCCEGVKNYSIAVKRSSDGIRFLRKIVRGGVDESYGIEVAKLAGLPNAIIKRANQILKELEKKAADPAAHMPAEEDQLSFTAINRSDALNMLKRTNIDELTDDELRELIREVIKNI